MMTLSIVPSDPTLVDLIGALNSVGSGGGFRNTERSFSAISGSVAKAWQGAVGPDHRIERKKLTPFSHSVFSRDDVVHWLEYGLAPFDMKMTHTKGQKSRIVKPRKGPGGKLIMSWNQKRKDGSTYTVHAGDPYLIIPMRHSTKGKGKEGQKSLEDVYPEVKRQMQGDDFQRSKVTKSPEKSGKVSPNYWRHAVERAEYSWGSRFDFPENDSSYDNLQGMVAMGPASQSQFMSFRVVSVNSPAASWLHPGIKARHNLENILERGQEQIRTVVEEAIKRDLI
jgi:hypothetical protein